MRLLHHRNRLAAPAYLRPPENALDWGFSRWMCEISALQDEQISLLFGCKVLWQSSPSPRKNSSIPDCATNSKYLNRITATWGGKQKKLSKLAAAECVNLWRRSQRVAAVEGMGMGLGGSSRQKAACPVHWGAHTHTHTEQET